MPAGAPSKNGERVMHPFTGIEITDKGIGLLSDYVAAIREELGMEVPLASDHYGHIGVNSCVRLARAMEKHQLAWMEDMVPWQFPELLRRSRSWPTCTAPRPPRTSWPSSTIRWTSPGGRTS